MNEPPLFRRCCSHTKPLLKKAYEGVRSVRKTEMKTELTQLATHARPASAVVGTQEYSCVHADEPTTMHC